MAIKVLNHRRLRRRDRQYRYWFDKTGKPWTKEDIFSSGYRTIAMGMRSKDMIETPHSDRPLLETLGA